MPNPGRRLAHMTVKPRRGHESSARVNPAGDAERRGDRLDRQCPAVPGAHVHGRLHGASPGAHPPLGRRPVVSRGERIGWAVATALALTVPVAVLVAGAASPATEQLRTSIDHVIRAVSDPDLKKPARTAER